MKNTTARTASATRPALVRPAPATLAPRPEDAPTVGNIGAVLHMVVTVPVTGYDEQCDPVRELLTWHAKMDRDTLDPNDPPAGVFVQLRATRDAIGATTETRVATFGDRGTPFNVDEFRRVVAGLNALAAALPEWPEPVV